METKIKMATKSWEGMNAEAKIKNSGELVVENKSDALKVSSRNERVLNNYSRFWIINLMAKLKFYICLIEIRRT